MENNICLDTDFLVNFLRGKKEEIEFIQTHEDKNILGTTMINLFELYYGAFKSRKPKEILSVELLKQRLRIINITEDVVRNAGELGAQLERQGKMLDFRDLLIGMVSLLHGFSLKTNNLKDFTRIPGLKIA